MLIAVLTMVLITGIMRIDPDQTRRDERNVQHCLYLIYVYIVDDNFAPNVKIEPV